MKKLIVLLFLSFVTGSLLLGCTKKEVEPRAINEETDKCDICNMTVMDNQFATQIVLTNGQTYVFDDIGCMYAWIDENQDIEVEASFVRDYSNKEWILSEEAFYVYNKDVKTPMAYNVISFENKSSAEEFVKHNKGELLDSKEIANHKWVMNHEMKEEHKKGHGHQGDMDIESNQEGEEETGSH